MSRSVLSPPNKTLSDIHISPGLSFKTQALYVAVFVTRYADFFVHYVSLYNSIMKVFFVGSSCFILYIMKYKYRSESHALGTAVCSADLYTG